MKITQHDIAQLSDHDVKRLAVLYNRLASEDGPFARFFRSAAEALVRAMRERRMLAAVAETEMLNPDDVVGAMVEESP